MENLKTPARRQRKSTSTDSRQKDRLEKSIIELDVEIFKRKKHLVYLNSLSEKDFRIRKKEQIQRAINQLEEYKEQLLERLLSMK